jgi:hypothetical protein
MMQDEIRPVALPHNSITLRLTGACLLLLMILSTGCGRNGGTFRDADDLDLGDEYQFTTADRETSPDEPPIILNDSLHVWVRYLGGCEDHDFQLGHQVRGDTARVWLRHDARGDDCEENFVERLSFRLPDDVLSREHVRLIDPDGDLPLIVNR